ncbi:MAG TPA: pyridoxamine 5'-phosphate oxidase [Acidisphaera sp.]|nr:pyridoxamine 5'-phosphate oxidase [Acidisphaera sp.]
MDTQQTPTVAHAEPFRHFDAWFAEAGAKEVNDPHAMTLATVGTDGRPSARIVLLKGHDEGGFVFYTNTQSRKGDELAAHPFAALLFHWKSLLRQVRIEGDVQPVTAAEADAYYASRPRLSRIGAWSSDQSRPLSSRSVLEQRVAENEAKYPGDDIPRPPHWSGYRIVPGYFEFWQDMPFRLHDRTTYTRQDGGWAVGKLFP